MRPEHSELSETTNRVIAQVTLGIDSIKSNSAAAVIAELLNLIIPPRAPKTLPEGPKKVKIIVKQAQKTG
jgi:hypothetical protein